MLVSEEHNLNTMSRDELTREIQHIYTLADSMNAILEKSGSSHHNQMVELATPFITQITNSAFIIAAFYAEVAYKKSSITPDLQETVESAFRNIFHAYKNFLDEAEKKLLPEGVVVAHLPETIGKKAEGMVADLNRSEKSLEQKFLERPKKGALQNRALAMENIFHQLNRDNEAELVASVAKIGRHAAQLVIEILESGINLVRTYDNAVPKYGPSSKFAREAAAIMIDPQRADAKRYS